MENNIENKMRFFAMYWGQKVMREQGKRQINTYPVSYLDYPKEHHWLELKSAAFISDDDAIAVAQVACPRLFITYSKGHKVIRNDGWVSVIHPMNKFSVDIHQEGYTLICDEDLMESASYQFHANSFEASRKLQELGYYVGTGLEVEYGWVKLIGGEYGK